MQTECLIVGAGMWGSVLAERLASSGNRVSVIDKRAHTGGNCHSFVDSQTGIECHAYGTHIFHTRNKKVWDYLSRFMKFSNYRHKVLTEHAGRMYSMPISLATINAFYNTNLKPFEVRAFLDAEIGKENDAPPANLEEKAVSLVGRPLYEAFIKEYTQKQWGKAPTELPASIITRLPVRSNYCTDYFDDPWQGLPLGGYFSLFENLLRHENIRLILNVEYRGVAPGLANGCRVFFSGAIDEFFDYRLGKLEWRGLRLETETMPYPDYQGAAVVNQADITIPYTRTHEFRHLHPEREYCSDKTVIVREYPRFSANDGDRYYPVNTSGNQELLRRYQALAREEAPHVVFGGRLGGYRYLDMDAVVQEALDIGEKHCALREGLPYAW